MNRRNFIKNMVVGAGSLSPLLRVGGGLGLFSAVSPGSASAASSFDDYKAIVVVNLSGGNDAMNTFIPTEDGTYAQYKHLRDGLAVEDNDLSDELKSMLDDDNYYKNSTSGALPYKAKPGQEHYTKGYYDTKQGLGIHGLMPEISNLFDKGKLSIVSNVGALVEPTTKADIDAETANLPQFLYSHIHQRKAVHSAQADIISSTGWAGRLADKWENKKESSSSDKEDALPTIDLNISFSKPTLLQKGLSSIPLVMGANGPKIINSGNLQELMKIFPDPNNPNKFADYYDKRAKESAVKSALVFEQWNSWEKDRGKPEGSKEEADNFDYFKGKKNAYGEPLFSISDHHKSLTNGLDERLFMQLKATAKMIGVTKEKFSDNRQIFYVDTGGYDFHGQQTNSHSTKLRSLSMGIADFYKAMEVMELTEKVLVIVTSEFGRTLRTNTDGTDHGWGGHSFMLCGDRAFNGGKVFGEVMTDLSVDGPNAVTKRARIIPTTSIEQMLAPALNWFDVDRDTMKKVLPNLENFKPTPSSDYESAYLRGVFS